jgi:hypothetical protein
VLQSCNHAPIAQVRLFDGFSGAAHWTRDVPAADSPRLLGADALPTLLADGEVQALSAADGTALAHLPVAPGADVQVGAAGSLTLVRIGGQLTALQAASGAAVWGVPARGLPASVAAATSPGAAQPLVVPEDGAFVRRNAATGAELGRSATPAGTAGGTATGIGPVVVVRLPDRVLAFH